MLSKDWPGMLLLKWYKTPDDGKFRLFFNRNSIFCIQIHSSFNVSADDWLYLPEKEVISTTITFLTLQNLNDIESLSTSEQFIYTMIAFLGKEHVFLDPDMKTLLAEFVQTFKSQEALDFDSKFGGKINLSLRP